MQLDIVTGKTIKLASKEVVRQIEVSNDLNLNNFIVVPDRFSMQMEKLIFKELKINSTFNINVISVSKLANLVLRLSGTEFSMHSDIHGALLVYKILISNKENLESFKDANLSIDLAKELYLTIAQIKSCEISAKEFCEKAKFSNSQKLIDIAKVFSLYEDIEKEKIDAADLISLFQKQIENSEIVKNSNFYFAEFDSFTGQVETVLKLLIKSAKKVVVGAPFSDGGNSYIYEKDILQKLSKICKELSVVPNIVEAKNDLNELQNHILQNLFTANQTPKEVGQQVTILNNLSCLEEVKKAANIIKFEIAKNGYRYQDFNIITSGLGDYSKYIQEIFAFEGISFYLDQNLTLNDLFPIGFIFNLFNFLKEKNAINFLQLASSEFSHLNGEDVFAINSLLQKDGKTLDYFISSNFSESENIFNFLRNIEKIAEKFKKIKDFNDFIQILNEIYSNFEFQNIINNLIEKFKMSGDMQNEKVYLQFPAKFQRAIKLLTELNISNSLNFEDAIYITKEIFGSVQVSSLPLSVDAVFVGESSSSFFEERKISFFLGCNAGQFPTMQKDAGIILDGEIEKYKLKIEPTMQMINRRNKFKLFNDAILAKEKIYLLRSGKGEVCEVVKNFSNMFEINGKKLPVSDDFYIYATGNKNLLKNNLIFSSVLNSNKLEIQKCLGEKVGDKKITNEIINNVENVLYPKRSTSISKAQKFFSCPFAHFAEYGLGLKELERAEINHLDIGNFFHAFAEKFLALCNNKHYCVLDVDFKKFVKIAYKFACGANERLQKLSGLSSLRGYFSFLDLQVEIFAEELLKQINMSEFKPEEFEKYFSVKLDCFGYKINGIIDRIDRAGKFARIIDYKTGESKVSLSGLYSGQQLQLPIYLLTLKDKVVGAFYLPVFESATNKDKRLSGYLEANTQFIKKLDKTLSPNKLKSEILNLTLTTKTTESEFKVYSRAGVLNNGNLQKIALYAKKVVEDGVRESLIGKITALPADEKICESCPYYSLCAYSFNFGEKREKVSGVKEETLVSLLEK